MGDTTYNVNVTKSTLRDSSSVLRINNGSLAAESDDNAATLRDLQELRELLEKTAKAVDELEKAVNAKNKPKIKALIGKLTSGAAENIITAVAGDALLSLIKSLK